jgi:hypothetical protein
MGVPQHVEAHRRYDAGSFTRLTHGTDLLGPLPRPAIVVLEDGFGAGASGDEAIKQLGASSETVT